REKPANAVLQGVMDPGYNEGVIALMPAWAQVLSIAPDGAPPTPIAATTLPPLLIGSPPPRITKPGTCSRPGSAAALAPSASLGLRKPAEATALPLLASVEAALAPSPRSTTMVMPSSLTTVAVTGKPWRRQSARAVVAAFSASPSGRNGICGSALTAAGATAWGAVARADVPCSAKLGWASESPTMVPSERAPTAAVVRMRLLFIGGISFGNAGMIRDEAVLRHGRRRAGPAVEGPVAERLPPVSTQDERDRFKRPRPTGPRRPNGTAPRHQADRECAPVSRNGPRSPIGPRPPIGPRASSARATAASRATSGSRTSGFRTTISSAAVRGRGTVSTGGVSGRDESARPSSCILRAVTITRDSRAPTRALQ